MSSCSCDWGGATLGSRLSGPHIARRAVSSKTGEPYACPICKADVVPGETCLDFAGLRGDDHSGWFYRMHADCFQLMATFKNAACRGEEDVSLISSWNWLLGAEFSVPWDIDEASAHALANSGSPFWAAWLFLYESIWYRFELQDAEGDIRDANKMLEALREVKPDWAAKYRIALEFIVTRLEAKTSDSGGLFWEFVRSLPHPIRAERLLKCT